VADEGGPLGRVFRHMHGAAADHRAAHGAGAQFCESHFYRHSEAPCSRLGWTSFRKAVARRIRLSTTNAKDVLLRKRVNHEEPAKRPISGPFEDFRPNRGQAQTSRERKETARSPPNRRAVASLPRFAGRRTDSPAMAATSLKTL
jgi:hypothetical protein